MSKEILLVSAPDPSFIIRRLYQPLGIACVGGYLEKIPTPFFKQMKKILENKKI